MVRREADYQQEEGVRYGGSGKAPMDHEDVGRSPDVHGSPPSSVAKDALLHPAMREPSLYGYTRVVRCPYCWYGLSAGSPLRSVVTSWRCMCIDCAAAGTPAAAEALR